MTFFPGQKKPRSAKGSFQNYGDHLCYLGEEADAVYKKLKPLETKGKLGLLIKEAKARLYILDAIRDQYDYIDEILAATVVPCLTGAVAMGLAAFAVWEGAHMLAIKAGFAADHNENHGDTAIYYLLLATAAAVFTIIQHIKALLSLVTRPLVTLIQGYKPQDTDRFYQLDIAERNLNFVATLGGLCR